MNTQSAKFITTIVATVAAGIPVWTVSYRDLSLTEPSFLLTWFAIGVAVTFLATLFSNMKSGDLISAVTVGFTIAIIIRFLADMFFGSIRHSNLGLDLLIAIGVGALSAWLGSFAIMVRKEKKAASK